MSGDDDFFSVARTIPFVARVEYEQMHYLLSFQAEPLMPNDVTP